MKPLLTESLSFDQASIILESKEAGPGQTVKDLYMKGICIQGGVRNANQRIYPISEISNAVSFINNQIRQGHSILGEADHPEGLKINIDRVSHMITEMWMDGPNGIGKLKILPTPMGGIIRSLLESGVKLGVSSRGSGNVNEHDGTVSGFEIVTVDAVVQPSAPNAYPVAVYEGLMNMRHGHKIFEAARGLNQDRSAQKYIEQNIVRMIKELKL